MCASACPASLLVFHLCATAINHSQSLYFGESYHFQNGTPPLNPSPLCQEWCEGPGAGRREEIAMSGRVPAEEGVLWVKRQLGSQHRCSYLPKSRAGSVSLDNKTCDWHSQGSIRV